MNERKKVLMDIYDITCSMREIYHYQKYSYKTLEDAVNYAKIDADRNAIDVRDPKQKRK